MAICNGCGTEIDVDEFDVARGDQLSCPECGVLLLVTGLSPVRVEFQDDDSETEVDENGEEVDEKGDDDAWD